MNNDSETFNNILNMSDNLLDTIMKEADTSVKTNASLIDGNDIFVN